MMAYNNHIELSQFLKNVHSSLRQAAIDVGPEKAWAQHCINKTLLQQYAEKMQQLATQHWVKGKREKAPKSRIEWATDCCLNYFTNKQYVIYRMKEETICQKLKIAIEMSESFSDHIKLLDVGSCYNPFKDTFLDVLAIDLCPANESVLQCDILTIPIGSKTEIDGHKLIALEECSFEVITFCFLLEYIPTSELRIKACENAYKLLKPGGLLIISTPDSKHVAANSKIMKCWRFTLSIIGFMRIIYEKFEHMHCMAFRKALCKPAAVRWSELFKEPYMEYSLQIPQDKNVEVNKQEIKSNEPPIAISKEDFLELPFSIDY